MQMIIQDVIFKLKNSSKILFQWFTDNQMKANPDKYHFIGSINDTVNLILGMKFDYELTFNAHIDDIVKK